MPEYPDTFWTSTPGQHKDSNDDLPAEALRLPDVLNRSA